MIALLAQQRNPVYIHVKDYGAVGDVQSVTDGALTTGTTALTSASGKFSAADVGKSITVWGAGTSGANLNTTIAAYVSTTHVTLASSAATTVSAARVAWGTDDSTAITNALSALSSLFPQAGALIFSRGIYRTSGLTLSNLSDVSVLGVGTGAVLAPTSGSTAISISGATRCSVGDLRIDGSYFNGAIGLSINGDFDSRFENLFIAHLSGDGIFVQGDAAAGLELSFMQVTCRDNGGWGYHHVRTTTTDHGGVYLTNFRSHYDTRGVGGINIDASGAASSTGAFHWSTNVTIDGYTSSQALLQMHNVHGIRFDGLWCAGTANSSGVVLIDGDGYSNELVHAYLLNNSTATTSYDLTVNGTQHDNFFDDLSFDGTGLTAFVHHGSTGANNNLLFFNKFGSVPLSDTMSALFASSTASNIGAITLETLGGNGQQSFGLDDPAHPGNQVWIRNSSGSFQILNTAFSTTNFRVDGGGFVFVGGGLNLNNGATLWSGSGVPGSSLGSVGDYYFRTDTPATLPQRLYVKTTSTVWVDLQAPVQSATAAAIATGGTITTSGVDVARVAPTAAVTGVILQAGTYAGQRVTVINESANSVTFAASATSKVAEGTSMVVAATSKQFFVWDSSTSLWY